MGQLNWNKHKGNVLYEYTVLNKDIPDIIKDNDFDADSNELIKQNIDEITTNKGKLKDIADNYKKEVIISAINRYYKTDKKENFEKFIRDELSGKHNKNVKQAKTNKQVKEETKQSDIETLMKKIDSNLLNTSMLVLFLMIVVLAIIHYFARFASILILMIILIVIMQLGAKEIIKAFDMLKIKYDEKRYKTVSNITIYSAIILTVISTLIMPASFGNIDIAISIILTIGLVVGLILLKKHKFNIDANKLIKKL